eukprot:TRINITY_DN45880_c0_g1_i1.p1 TRINITY_DN45880_c0_g1~~TRINITY_DN45880_c0_g1_i1.p1  ORF type:complete len:587 (+),score=83.96 TRINITY_DN45880_c0_g1_i1:75-1835(+)
MMLAVSRKTTAPISGQKPGTNGLRKRTTVFMEGNYLHNYVQSVFDTLVHQGTRLEGGTLVVSGDGRYFNSEAIQIIIKMALANGVGRIWLGTCGLLSTPATSAVIRNREGGTAFGGFICTASHNPGGRTADFGIKFNCQNGGPAPEKMTDEVARRTAVISEYFICENVPTLDLDRPQTYTFEGRIIEVIDCVEDHLDVLKQCFDFQQLKALIAREDFTFCYDCMHGVQGPYARRILEDELGGKRGSCINADPREDFGGPSCPSKGHADPNLKYAVELMGILGIDEQGRGVDTDQPTPTFGAGADGDADRNMILGSHFFVSPSDSLAVIVANAQLIPQFAGGLRGCGRSMATGAAVDFVARKQGIPCFEVPTGWKYFGNLMDSGTKDFPGKPSFTPFICGEESFGTGADHLREKDGMWAVLAWLQILAAKSLEAGKLVTVQEVVEAHWREFGRNYYVSYHYENITLLAADAVMAAMREKQGKFVGEMFGDMIIQKIEEWDFHDRVDDSISERQGIRVFFEDGSRIVFRLSGTGAVGATVRLYLDRYVAPDGDLSMQSFEVVRALADVAMTLSGLVDLTGLAAPTTIT